MTRIYGERADNLRKVFEATPEEELTHQTLFERMGVAAVGQAEERTKIRNALPALVRNGYVLKTGLEPGATYRHSGKRKTKPTPPAGRGRRQRPCARSGTGLRRRFPVAQFEARGGRVEILPTAWDRVAA